MEIRKSAVSLISFLFEKNVSITYLRQKKRPSLFQREQRNLKNFMPQYISIKGLFSSKKNDLTLHWYNYRTRCNLSRVCEHGYNKIKRKPTHIYKKCLENFPLLIHFKLKFGSRIFSVMSILWWEYKIGCIKIIPSSLSRIILAEARPLNLLVSI